MRLVFRVQLESNLTLNLILNLSVILILILLFLVLSVVLILVLFCSCLPHKIWMTSPCLISHNSALRGLWDGFSRPWSPTITSAYSVASHTISSLECACCPFSLDAV